LKKSWALRDTVEPSLYVICEHKNASRAFEFTHSRMPEPVLAFQEEQGNNHSRPGKRECSHDDGLERDS